jgi:hypothetical protein
MGNTESLNENIITTEMLSSQQNTYYHPKYNLLPSFININEKIYTKQDLIDKFHLQSKESEYEDLRNNFPNIIDIDRFPFNPIASVSYVIHYSLLKNKLPVFPPSMMYIYKNLAFYKNNNSLMNFQVIFNSIRSYGFCSENEFRTNIDNLNSEITTSLLNKSLSFKFLNIYKISNDIDSIKILLQNKFPILIGFTLFNNLINITDKILMPDKERDTPLGGLSGVIVGYIESQQNFILALTFGEHFGNSGFISIPYEYITNYTFELFVLDIDYDRVIGNINQKKKMVKLDSNVNTEYNNDMFASLFS